jgi:hypothetical protein
MANVKVSIVHDEFGEIVSVGRPEGANVIVLAGERQSVFVTEVDEKNVEKLIGRHRVDISRKLLVSD